MFSRNFPRRGLNEGGSTWPTCQPGVIRRASRLQPKPQPRTFSSPQRRRHRRRNTARAPPPLLSRSRRGFQALYVGEDGAGNLHGRNRGACAGDRGGPLRRRSGLHHPPGRRGLRHPQVDATRRLLVSQSFANTSPSLVVLWWPWLLALILLHPDANV